VNDSEYASRWRLLRAQLSELERNARIDGEVNHLHDAASLASAARNEGGGGPGVSDVPLRLLAKRNQLRQIYFNVSQPALRKALIAKQRELELFERTRMRIRLEDAQHHLETIRRRPSEGWWLAAIVGAALVIVGYWLFTLAGAICGGVAALFVGSGIEQAARRRFAEAIVSAEEDVRNDAALAALAEQSGDLFTDSESATGQPDRPFQHAGDFSASAL
jgi:hypothetical protein